MRSHREIHRKIAHVEQKDWYLDGPVIDAVIEEGFVKALNDVLAESVEKQRLERFKQQSSYTDDFNRKADFGYLLGVCWVQERDHPFGGEYP